MSAKHAARKTVRIPVIREDLVVERRPKELGRVRITKLVSEREEIVDEPLVEERVSIQRVPIGREVKGPIEVRLEGDTLVIPVLEERLVTEKRLILKEEIHISRVRREVKKPQRVVLRAEHVRVERVSNPSAERRPKRRAKE